MQTFLPYADFSRSAECLDRARLGKQRLEAFQILRTLTGQTNGWANHPAVKMWSGYEAGLAAYGLSMCDEWISRGYHDSLSPIFIDFLAELGEVVMPPWFGDERLHASHRSALLRKDPVHYGNLGWTEPPTLEYHWPSHAAAR